MVEKKDKYLLIPKAICYLTVGLDSIWRTYNPIWFKNHNFGFLEIGFLRSLCIIGIITGPIFSILADKSKKRKEILILILLSYLTITKILDKYSEIFQNRKNMIIVFLIFNIIWSGLKPVSEGLVLAYLKEDKKLFGRQMTFMALGWLVNCTIAGYLYTWYGFYACWNLMLFLFFVLFFVLFFFVKGEEQPKEGFIAEDIAFFEKLDIVLKKLVQGRVVKVLVVLAVQGAGMNMVQSFLFVYLNNELNAPEYICGLSVFCTCLVELPIFFFSHKILKFFGINILFIIAQLAFIIRIFLYTILTESTILWILPIATLHGLTYANMWNSAAQFASEFCPKGLESVCMLILSFCHHYLGAFFGNLIGGLIYKYYGAKVMFYVFGVFGLFVCAGFSFVCFEESRRGVQSFKSGKNDLSVEMVERGN